MLSTNDTIERRRGPCIAARGIYRYPVRSSRSHFVKASGLCWLSVMLPVPIAWAHRMWALPVLTALAPTDHVRQLLHQILRWLPQRELLLQQPPPNLWAATARALISNKAIY